MLDRDIAERTRLAGSNKFELLLFRLGEGRGGQRELFGINVFKVREVLVMPPITELANAHQHLRGVANIRGQIIPVIDLPAVMGCTPHSHRNILMVTEFARTVQGFAVEDVREIVRLEWNQVEPSEASDTNSLITGIARVDGDATNTRLAQVLDVEQIIKNVLPATQEDVSREVVGPALLDTVGMAAEADRPIGELAYGDVKRVELAIALAAAPRLLLMDEPTAGMSPEETKVMMDLIVQLAAERSVILVEHKMKLVMGICERLLVLHHGEFLAEGTPDEIRANADVRRVYLGQG